MQPDKPPNASRPAPTGQLSPGAVLSIEKNTKIAHLQYYQVLEARAYSPPDNPYVPQVPRPC